MVRANEHGQLFPPKTIDTGLYFTGTNKCSLRLIRWRRKMHCLAEGILFGTYVLS